ncbi:SRPBCC family protein [Nocardia sp. NBC_00508]|uniref:SRPBCC family protein n=1 Tax=Nocardia sp. NBC_00508 TaxID=2975992 RepID=UPI002E80DB51|nr:SRPBCC family protein [Nocardia sp. NBC_00508]WUD66072.1 SRPBCC family protein [Nocardia sp. NBC_00508]
MSRRTLVLGVLALLIAAAAVLATVGSLRDSHIVTVTRTTDANPDVMWELWSNVPARTEWDRGLEYINVDGPFEAGTTGTVKVEGQDPVRYEIVEVTPKESFTDRFESLLGTHTDWHHTIQRRADGRYDVTWRLETRGPLSLISLPVLKSIFGEEVPTAVTEFVQLAENRSPH